MRLHYHISLIGAVCALTVLGLGSLFSTIEFSATPQQHIEETVLPAESQQAPSGDNAQAPSANQAADTDTTAGQQAPAGGLQQSEVRPSQSGGATLLQITPTSLPAADS